MDLDTLLSFSWHAMVPEFIILGTATLLSLLDLFLPRSFHRKWLGWLGVGSIIATLIFLLTLIGDTPFAILYDTFRLDSFAIAFKLVLLVAAGFVLLLAISYEPKEKLTEFRGEFFYLFLVALLGAMIMSSSADLITLFVGLELMTLSSYILVGIRKKHLPSNESAMKYVINGGIATAITLFGMSYLYGIAGTTNILEMAGRLQELTNTQHLFLLALAFLMILVGLSFKIAAAPFHMWTPDVYEGAPIPVTAFLSIISKAAGFILIIRMFITVFYHIPDVSNNSSLLMALQNFLAVLAAVTMIWGNLVALRQTKIKRMLAYSSIAHAGYLLVAVTAFSAFMVETIWFYLTAYLFMTIAVFSLLQLMNIEELKQLSGLSKRAPLLAVALALTMLGLAGIPGTSGFIGKLNIFLGALSTEPTHYLLAVILIATTVISYIYYFKLIVYAFFREANHTFQMSGKKLNGVIISICVMMTILLGVFPQLAYDFLHQNFLSFYDFLQ